MAMLTTRQTLTPTWHACPPDGHDDPRRSRADRAVGRGAHHSLYARET